MGSKLRERLKEATADAILGAAEEEFAQRGVHQAKVDDIAERAGVSVGTLYNYFPDRDGLLCSLMVARRTEILDRFDEILKENSELPLVLQLEHFFRALGEHFDAHREFFAIVFESESAHQKTLGKQAPREVILAFYQRVKVLVERGVQRGELRPELADLLPGIFMGVWRSSVMLRLYEGSRAPLATRAKDLARFILEGAGVQPHG
jgi:AcrR family transcriptional regulator